MSRFDVPAFGQVAEKPFADIPTSIKLLVAAGIVMAFVAPKKVKVRANPKKEKLARDIYRVEQAQIFYNQKSKDWRKAIEALLGFCMRDCIDGLPSGFPHELYEAGVRIPISEKEQRKLRGMKSKAGKKEEEQMRRKQELSRKGIRW